MIARLGVRLALTRSAEHRWRQVAVPASTVVALLLLLFAADAVAANGRQQERNDARTVVLSSVPGPNGPPKPTAPTDLFATFRTESYRGSQYQVVWIAPTSGTPPVLPPGVNRVPGPGEAFVSPALARAIRSDPLLAERYPSWSLIGDEGVGSSDELLAYAALPPDSVSGTTFTVARFGDPGPSDMVASFQLEELPSRKGVIAGAAIFLAIPALVVLYLGVSATSIVRDHRFAILFHLGVPRRFHATIAVMETLALAIPALMGGVGVWLVVAPNIGPLPVLRADPMAGDLVLPWGLVATVTTAVCIIVAAMAALGPALIASRAELRPRPGRSRPALARLRGLPFLAAVAVLFVRPFVARTTSELLLPVAFLLFLFGVPLAAPWVLRMSGLLLAKVRTVPALLAGRRLAWDPIRNARPHLAAALLIALTLGVTGYNAVVASEIAPPRTPDTAFGRFHPRAMTAAQFEELAAGLRPALVLVAQEEGRTWSLGTTCDALKTQVPGLECAPTDARQLGPGEAERVASALGIPASVRLEPSLAPATVPDRFVVVLDAASDPADLEVRVAAAVARHFPASSVSGNASDFRGYYAPEQSWVTAGLAAAGVVLGLGTVVPIMDRLMATRRERRNLLRIGVTERWLRVLETVLFSVPFLVVVAIGAAIGTTACWLWVTSGDKDVPMPWPAIAVILAAAFAVGVLGSLVAGTTAAHVATRERRD